VYLAQENLQERLSVTVLDYGAYQAEPLRRKPLVLMREVVESMVTHVERLLVSGAVGAADVVVLPLHTEKDFLAPELLQKYVLTLFSALTSFGPRMVEFFASPQRFAQIARPLARLLQLSHCSVVANDRSLSTSDAKTRSHQAQQLQQDVLLELLNWRSSTYQKHQTVSDSSAKAAVEQALWSLTLMTDDVQPSDLPRADEALALFRLYRGVLTSARFKTSTQSIQRRRAWRVQRSGSTGTTSVADTPRKRVAPLAGSSSASELAGFAGAERASPVPLSLDTAAAAAPASTPAVSAAEVEVDGFFATVETLCMLSRACYLAASMATAATSDGNDSTSAAVLAELLPASHTPMLTTLDASGPGHVASNSTMNVTAAAAAALASGGGGAKRAAVYDNVDMSKPYEPKVIPKTSTISHLLTRVVQQNILFRNFKSEEHASIVEAFECVTTKAGEIVIKQGDSGEYFYIIEQGKLDVFMESCGLRIKVGRTLGTGDYFGELALMYNTPRAATVVSTEASTLWRIDRTTYRSIVTHHNKITSDEYFQLVSNVTILGKRLGDVLSAAELSKVVSTLEIEEFEPDAVIIRQHATGDYFYIISEGQVDVFQEAHLASNGAGGAHDRDEERSVLGAKLATLSRGDCFGEKALLADDVRQASCVAVGRVVCLSLSRDDFIAMIGSWQDVTAAQDVQRLALAAKRAKIRASVYDSQYHLTINLDELERLNTLGEGAFGRVLVARHKNSGQLYALKCQAKAFICAQNMQEMVLNEVAIMKQLDHPLITKLHAVIQDRRYIYFLLELLPGGEFFSFLQTAGKLSEDKARFYAASVVLALDELHKAKIAYRDLKPENMVMDSRGYVKLVDFGLAKQVLSGSTW
jgi:CRP-like cAMP-binding protein